MLKNVQFYLYGGIVLGLMGVFVYIAYVFHDRAEAKKMVVKQESTIETKTIEVKLTGIAEHAKGKLEQLDKEKKNEANTSLGVHTYTF